MCAFDTISSWLIVVRLLSIFENLIRFLFMLKMHCGIVLRFSVSTSVVVNLYYEAVLGLRPIFY